jgi:hypothetical protein
VQRAAKRWHEVAARVSPWNKSVQITEGRRSGPKQQKTPSAFGKKYDPRNSPRRRRFAESGGELSFNPFAGMILYGSVVAGLAFSVTLFLYWKHLRKLAFSGEMVVCLISSIVFGFLIGAMIEAAISTVFWRA